MRTPNTEAHAALWAALSLGVCSAPQLAEAAGLTNRQVLRILETRPADVLSAGLASRRRYALRKPLRGDSTPHPVYALNAQGQASQIASINLIQPQGSHCDLSAHWPCESESQDGWWHGLPYPLYDMQPQGFLGRAFARQEHQVLEVPPNPKEWQDHHVLYVLSRRAFDTSGNLIVGDAALRLYQASRQAPPVMDDEVDLVQQYNHQAQQAASLGLAGSSAAGEFPKFTTQRQLPGMATPHVIVKFSGVVDGSPAVQRWADLLVCEHLAIAQSASLPGITPAATRVLQGQGRTFLESERFDRIGSHGRRALVSLASLAGVRQASHHLLGMADDWPSHAQALAARKLLPLSDAQAVAHLWWFGRLIANADMHWGNLALFCHAAPRPHFNLAPVYDMLPMAYAPLPGAEVPPVQWQPPLPLPQEAAVWQTACTAALAFWSRAAADGRVSEVFRAICAGNVQRLERARQLV